MPAHAHEGVHGPAFSFSGIKVSAYKMCFSNPSPILKNCKRSRNTFRARAMSTTSARRIFFKSVIIKSEIILEQKKDRFIPSLSV